VDGEEFLLTPDAWTMVATGVSSAIVIPRSGGRIRAQVAGEDTPPPLGAQDTLIIRGLRIIRSIGPFQALWLRADLAAPVAVTVYRGNSMSGVVYFGKTPFRLQGPGQSEITVPFLPQTLDGGAPTTDYTELAVIDCGGPTITTTVRTIDGRVEGDLP
jgi:hypothetical protein